MKLTRNTRLTPHFRAGEFAVSASRPDLVTPPEDWTAEEADRITYLAAALDRVRVEIGAPLVITSGLRRPALNRAIGGARRSHHLTGEAADVRPPLGWTAVDLLEVVDRLGIPTVEAIAYPPHLGGHLHLVVSARKGPPPG